MPTQTGPRPRLAWLRPITRRANWFMAPLVAWLPGFGVLSYTGRKSGKRYRTPLTTARHGSTFAFALAYGSDVQWLKNVLASGTAELRRRGRTYPLRNPQVRHDPRGGLAPLSMRLFLRLLRVSEYVTMTIEDARATNAR